MEKLFKAWKDFSTGKREKKDVQLFESRLEDELCHLFNDLLSGTYHHGSYERFIVNDPKRRVIHKATVRDRVVHRLLYNTLLPIFHRQWLGCSFSCRPGFGQHKSMEAVRRGLRKITQNDAHFCWILKCDIRKFFDSIDHRILISLLDRKITDPAIKFLLKQIIESFSTVHQTGLPIGNLTSQVFANVYLHELDWYMKQTLKHHFYFRYADDFLFLCHTQEEAEILLQYVEKFLRKQLRLDLHPRKVILRKRSWGIDWLGHVMLPGHEVLRPTARRGMMRKVKSIGHDSQRMRLSLASYHGCLKGTARRRIDQELLQIASLERAEPA